MKTRLFLHLSTVVLFLISLESLSDGGFVWSGADRLREPQQKAIIVFDEGVEDIFLQVKYEGSASDFGWIVPVPSLPEIKKMTYSPFLQIEENQGTKLFKNKRDILKTIFLYERPPYRDGQSVSSVEEISKNRIGIYDASVLKANDGNALNEWLAKNGFKMPEKSESVFNHYISNGWYFVVLRIKSGLDAQSFQKAMRNGDLQPIHLVFKAENPIYPFFISSINGGKTKLLMYLFAKQLYANELFRPQISAFITPEELLNDRKTLIDKLRKDEDSISFHYVSLLDPALYHEIKRGIRYDWFMMRIQKEFDLPAIKEDLVFTPDQKLIKSIIADFDEFCVEKGYYKYIEEKYLSRKKKSMESEDSDYVNDDFSLEIAEESFIRPVVISESLSSEISREEFIWLLYEMAFGEKPNPIWDNSVQTLMDFPGRWSYIAELVAAKWILRGEMDNMLIKYMANSGLLHKFSKIANEKEKEILEKYVRSFMGRGREYVDERAEMPELLRTPATGLAKRFSGRVNLERGSDNKGQAVSINVGFEVDGEGRNINNAIRYQREALYELHSKSDPGAFVFLKEWLVNDDPRIRQAALCLMLNSAAWDMDDAYPRPICETAFDDKESNLAVIRPLLYDKDEAGCFDLGRIIRGIGWQKTVYEEPVGGFGEE